MGERKKKESTERARALQTVEKERIVTLEFAQKLGKSCSGLTVAAGIMLISFSVYLMTSRPFTSLVDIKLFLFMILSFLGALNVISGLLLMGRAS